MTVQKLRETMGRMAGLVTVEGEAIARGVELITLNPKEIGPEAFDARLREISEGRGFDDIVSLDASKLVLVSNLNGRQHVFTRTK